jgi:hypothetical protein
MRRVDLEAGREEARRIFGVKKGVFCRLMEELRRRR